MKPTFRSLVVASALVLGSAWVDEARAQVWVSPAPVVSYYTAPAPAFYVAPAPVVAAAPVVPYVAPAPPPTISYYAPATSVTFYAGPTVSQPATVSRGLFGRTIVRTPFYKLKY